MSTFVADPHWGWWIVWYFYLGGIAAGAYFIAALVELVGDEHDRKLGRVGYFLAAPLVVVCGVLLILDLEHPTRFWHMLFDAQTFRPHMKYWSPMSIGAWALMVFGAISTISFLGALAETGCCGLGRFVSVASRLHRGWFGRAFDWLGAACGFFVASYTGALLTATNQPVWSDSQWIAAVFLASAATSGIAAIDLVSWLGRCNTPPESRARLERTDGWALGLELAALLFFLGSLGDSLRTLLYQWPVVWLLTAAGGGVCLPAALRLWPRLWGKPSPWLPAVLVLTGGFVLRYAILGFAPALLRR